MTIRTSHPSKPTQLALYTFWVLFFMTAHAGGLGIAPLAAIAGVFGVVSFTHQSGLAWIKKTPFAIWCLLVFVLWAYITQLWSPYDSGAVLNNPLKLLIGVPLYLIGAAWFMSQNSVMKSRLAQWIFVLAVLWACVLCFDLYSGYSFSWLIDPPKPNMDLNIKRGDSLQNLSHAVSVAALLVAPLLALVWRRGWIWRLLGFLYAALIFGAGGLGDGDANMVAAVLAMIVFLCALKKPKLFLALTFLISGACIAFAPLLAWVALRLGLQYDDKLPFSWAERVENWGYMYGKIAEKPLFGHGFDAVRTFNETHTIRGFDDRAIVSLHPHNAGIHIWAETGLVGALLAVTTLYFGWKCLANTKTLLVSQSAASAGLLIAATVISSISYGVWQDWWWAAIILSASVIGLSAPKQQVKG